MTDTATSTDDVPTEEVEPWLADPLAPPIRTRNRVMLMALVGSLLLHMTPLAPLVIAYILEKAGVARGQPEQDEAENRLGNEKGKLEGVNVEIIDAAEYDRRYMSTTAGKATGNEDRPQVEPTPTQEPVPPEPPKPEPQEAREQKQEQQQQKPIEVVKPQPAEEPALSPAEAEQLLRQAQSQFESYADTSSKASLAALGNASPAVREILRKLKRAMPRGKNERGSLIVRIILNEAGGVAALGLVKSSGSSDLDNRVLASVRNTLIESSAVRLKPNERQLQITYDYF